VERNNSSVNGVTLEAIPKLIQGAVMQLDETSAEIPHAKALPEL